jgi:alpha-maltose-1-phosphate synthase
MKTLLLTREYPPYVYGGAGVHVDHLSRELAKLIDVEVRSFGDQSLNGGKGSPAVIGLSSWKEGLGPAESRARKALDPLTVNIKAAALPTDADVVHCHTWYSMMGGLWVKILNGIPLVITTHSLEPLRPWKEEQLGRGYQLSLWIERTGLNSADAVIAVSEVMKHEVLECYDLDERKVHVIYNGIDVDVFRPQDSEPVLRKYGIPTDRPYLLFVGRITRQKGVLHLVEALNHVAPELQAVLLAGAPDTEEIGLEMEAAVSKLKESRPGVHWIPQMLAVPELMRFYSGATLFVCPSIYEPFGIINLEAMACACPVVASRVGGIPEVVTDGETGYLVPFESEGPPSYQPRDRRRFALELADSINRMFALNPRDRKKMGEAGRRRAQDRFSWASIARQTEALYRKLSGRLE